MNTPLILISLFFFYVFALLFLRVRFIRACGGKVTLLTVLLFEVGFSLAATYLLCYFVK